MKRKIVIAGFAVLMMFLAVLIWTISPAGRITITHEYLITKYYQFYQIDEKGIVQWFEPNYNYLETIDLFIANIYPETEGKIKISLLDSNGKECFSKEYEAASIPAGEFVSYKLNKKLQAGERYSLKISFSGVTDTKEGMPQIMVSKREKNLPETQEAEANGGILDHSVAITYHYAQLRPFRF